MSTSLKLQSYTNTESKTDLMASTSDIRFEEKKSCPSTVKMLAFLLVLTLLVAAGAVVALVFFVHRGDERMLAKGSSPSPTTRGPPTTTPIPVDDTACMTPGCVVAAARVYESIDHAVHPCDNFYDFACGNWAKKHIIPEDSSSISAFSIRADELEVTLKALLEAPSPDDELEAVTKAKDMYTACLDEEKLEERGLEPMERIYEEYGDWPLLKNSWDPSTFNLYDRLLAIAKYGSAPLIYMGVSTDLKNSTVMKIQLDEPNLMMSRDNYFSNANKSIPAIKKYIRDMAQALGAENMTLVEQDVNDIFEFETTLANMTTPREERRDVNKLYTAMTIGDLYTNMSDQFDWMRWISGRMNMSGVDFALTMEEPIVVFSTRFLREIIPFLQQTPPRVLANYLWASDIGFFEGALPKRIQAIGTEYSKTMYGVREPVARWKTCMSSVNFQLGNAIGREFVDTTFDEDAKDIAFEMIADIREAFNELLTYQDWMDDATRAVAKEKADAMREKIGYDQKLIRNDSRLNDRYKEYTYDPDTFFENVLKNWEVNAARRLRDLRKTYDKDEWQSPPALVNAFYNPYQNSITFPAGILQPPFFSKHYPRAMNFGGIGVVIGHEITHGFDDRGRLYDKEGDLAHWWSDDIVENFKAKAGCIIHQYSNFTVPEIEMQLNGVNTQGENIADNGGLRQSYRAYRQWVSEQGKEEQKLPGLDFTPNQLFFINFAQLWCNLIRPESAIQQVMNGVHSPGKFRVIGTLQNSKEFSEAFNCPRTSYMNPEDKCRVW